MKIFLSYSAADKTLAEQIRSKIESAGHHAISANSIRAGEYLMPTVSKMLREADACIAVISQESKNNKYMVWEWQTALEQSWEIPDKMLVGIVIGNIDPPPFLQGRAYIRVNDKSKIQVGIENIFNFIKTNDTRPVITDELKRQVSERRSKMIDEILLFQLSDVKLEEQRKWIVERIAHISQVDPDSIDIAKLKMKLADILKRMGKEAEIVPLLRDSVHVLEKNKEVAAPKIAKAQMSLAKALDKIGDHDGAINQLCHAMDLCGMESNPNQVKQQLMVFKSKLPELTDLLSSAIEKASSETAQHARRLIKLIDNADMNPANRDNRKNTGGGESC